MNTTIKKKIKECQILDAVSNVSEKSCTESVLLSYLAHVSFIQSA